MNILLGKGIQLLAKPLKNARKMKGLGSWCDSAPSKHFKKEGNHMNTIWGPYGPYGVHTGPLGDHYGTIMGPIRDQFGTNTAPLWDQYGTIMGPLWDQYGTIIGPLREHYGTIMGLL